MSETINPAGWPRPSGYANGVVAEGRYLAISGQIGWNERYELVGEDFLEQARQALRNVVAVLRAAGGAPEHLVRLTWYITNKDEYRDEPRSAGLGLSRDRRQRTIPRWRSSRSPHFSKKARKSRSRRRRYCRGSRMQPRLQPPAKSNRCAGSRSTCAGRTHMQLPSSTSRRAVFQDIIRDEQIAVRTLELRIQQWATRLNEPARCTVGRVEGSG